MMLIIRFFDYMYYRIYFLYKNKWKDDTPGAYATSLVTLLQSLYLIILPIFFYELINSKKVDSFGKYIIIVDIVLFILNIYRYNKVSSYRTLAKKWDAEDKSKRKKRGILVLSIFIITIGLTLALAIILGEINKYR